MTKLVTIFGGSGFLGRYVAQQMAHEGWRVRVAVRRPNEAMHVKPYGNVGQVEPVLCNIRDDASVRAAIKGADAVVNCVGILKENGRNKFDAVQHEGASRVAEIAADENVARLVHVSALGADENADSDYSRSKGLGEKAVSANFPDAIIIRPSVIFGAEDGFFNKFARMSRFGPILPIVGGDSYFQPVFVGDVARAIAVCVLGKARSGVYELGGPEVVKLSDLVAQLLSVIERRKLVLNLPFWVGKIFAGILDITQSVSLGLFQNTIVTRDQVIDLRTDKIVSPDARGFEALGITPVAMDSVLPEYLWPFRPSGQFAAIKSSASNMKV